MEKFETRHIICREREQGQLYGMLHLPKSNPKPPLVIICHGYKSNRIGRFGLFVEVATNLSKKGIATFRFDFSGCGESEGNLHDLTPQDKVNEVLFHYKTLQEEFSLDHTRVGLVGNSLGGAIAALTAPHIPHLKALCLAAAIADGELFLQEWQNTYQIDPLIALFQNRKDHYEAFKKAKPAKTLNALKDLNVLSLHGDSDDIVHPGHMDLFRKERQGNSKDRFVTLPGVNHYFAEGEERITYLEEISSWICDHLS